MNTPLLNEINTVCWRGNSDGHLEILDQTQLPTQITHVVCKDVPTVVESIQS
ncbi:MAG TPA: S-methyl-5-thioribose-1-phosphate isomerase, partial [Planctomycetaceae bacterium]|nr:S-methyl-5-thioribose-1-phosphate isomerase [Planctomycetaceae bacterium]